MAFQNSPARPVVQQRLTLDEEIRKHGPSLRTRSLGQRVFVAVLIFGIWDGLRPGERATVSLLGAGEIRATPVPPSALR